MDVQELEGRWRAVLRAARLDATRDPEAAPRPSLGLSLGLPHDLLFDLSGEALLAPSALALGRPHVLS